MKEQRKVSPCLFRAPSPIALALTLWLLSLWEEEIWTQVHREEAMLRWQRLEWGIYTRKNAKHFQEPQDTGKSHRQIHPVLQEGTSPADTVISDPRQPEQLDTEFLSFEAIWFAEICYCSPREPIWLISDSWTRLQKRSFRNENSPKKLGKTQNAVSSQHSLQSRILPLKSYETSPNLVTNDKRQDLFLWLLLQVVSPEEGSRSQTPKGHLPAGRVFSRSIPLLEQ